MAIISHRVSFRKGLSIIDRRTQTRGHIEEVTANGVVAHLDNGKTLYLTLDEARMRLATDLGK
jgi:hypothetical protein